MLRKWLGVLVLGTVLLGVPTNGSAQDGISRKQQEKTLAKKAKEDKKAKVRKEKEDRKRHLNNQDKATRKRMKRNTKRADRHGSDPHRDGFFRRTFGW
jgi:hypothetical protein